MKLKFTYLFLIVSLCHVQEICAQDFFRTSNSGNWSDPSIWESSPDGIIWGPAGIAPDEIDGTVTIRNTHTVTVSSTVTANEVVIASGGALTVNSSFTITDEAAAAVDLDVQTGGILNIGNAMAVSGTWNNAGTVNWSAGNISFTNATLNNNGVISITGNNDMTPVSGTNTLNNNSGASITKSVGTNNTTINVALTNAGTINVNTGTIINSLGSTAPHVTNSGTIAIASGALFSVPFGTPVDLNANTALSGAGTFRSNGATTVNFALSVPSTLTFDKGGNVTGSGSLTINGTMNWTANPVAVPLTIASGATLNATTAGTNKTLSATLVNNGTVNWNASTSLFLSNATVTNNGTFNWNTATNLQIGVSSGTGTVNNPGTFNKTVTGTTLTVAAAFNNTNILKGVGIMNFTGTLTNSGTLAPGNSPGLLTINPSAISSTSTVEIEITNAGGPTAPGTSFDQLTLTGSTNLAGATLTIVDADPAPPGVYTILTTGTGSFSGNFTTVNKPVNYGDPVVSGNTVTIEKLFVLPLIWGEFSVKAVDQHAELNWQTLQESNTRNFIVERSTDGIHYTALTAIAAQGYSAVATNYSYTDYSPDLNAPNFYRVKQVDLDGQFEYSAVRTLKVQGVKGESLAIQGNPVKNNVLKVNVTAASAITIALSDMSGRVIKTQVLQPGVHSIPVTELRVGTYQVTIMQDGRITGTKRIVKL